MPNAFRLGFGPQRIQKHFALAKPPRFSADTEECGPGHFVLTIEWDVHGKAVSQLARFGFKMRDGALPVTGFRCESIKPAAPPRAFTEGRCIVPVDLFYEKVSSAEEPQVVSYAARDGRIIGLAGMLRPEATGLSVTILTVPADAVVRSLNRRMPAVLCEEDYVLWMDDTTSVADAIALIQPSHDDQLVEHPAPDQVSAPQR